jgi:hypothetical protein
MMVVESQEGKRVVGLSTSRDLLRILAAVLRDTDDSDVAAATEVLNERIG